MIIEIVNVEGKPQTQHIKRHVLKRIVLAAKIRLDDSLSNALAYITTAADQEDYSEILDILEGGMVDVRLAIEAIQAADALHIWIDALVEQELEQETQCQK